jgi:hypothetical protein
MLRVKQDEHGERLMNEMEAKYSIGVIQFKDVDLKASLDNRARLSAPLIERSWRAYAEFMKLGDIFPMIIVLRYAQPQAHKPYLCKILGGNNRFKAMTYIGETECEAYIVEETSFVVSDLLARRLNCLGGDTTPYEERVSHCLHYIEAYNATQAEAAEMFFITKSQMREEVRVQAIRNDLQANKIKAPNRTLLRRLLVLTSNKKVMLAVAKAIDELRPSTTLAESLIAAVKVADASEAAMLAMLAEQRRIIEQQRHVKANRRTPASELYSLLARIKKVVGASTSLTQLGVTDHELFAEGQKRCAEVSRKLRVLAS